MQKPIIGIKQRLMPQTLERVPEDQAVMYGEEQNKQYTKDGEDGSLAILYDFMINTLLKTAPTEGKALDICCGSAQLLCKIAKALPGVYFTGLDLSPAMLAFAEMSKVDYGVENVSFVEGSMYDLPQIFDETFDLITWDLALHHCDTKEQVISVFNHIAALAKPDATIFIFDIIRPKTQHIAQTYADIFNRRQGDWYYNDSLASYMAAFTYEEMAQMLRESDLYERGFVHIQPWIMNFHQIISIAPAYRQKNGGDRVNHLKYLWQKIDYQLLRLTFL